MRRLTRLAVPVAVLIALGIYSAFPRPTGDVETLRAIAAESQQLLRNNPMSPGVNFVPIPENKWPPAIASLKPTTVTVRPGMVDIPIRPSFDGGWGYGFAKDREQLTMLPECWSELNYGVYWHRPC